MNANTLRRLHRTLAPWLAVLLILTALTGVSYRVGRAWFGMDKTTGHRVLALHTGDWMGTTASTAYTVVVAAGIVVLAGSGIAMAVNRPGIAKTNKPRRWHAFLGLAVAFPLLVSAATGTAYTLGVAFFSISEETRHFLMTIHEGAWLGRTLKVYYVLLLGTGALALAFSGLRLRPKPRLARGPAEV